MSKTLGLIATIALSLTVFVPTAALARVTAADCDTAEKAVKAEIDAACPCDGAPAHADHVRCVTKKLRELSSCAPGVDRKHSCGSIPRACVAKIRRVASRSACGQPEGTVTCCVGKQRDCTGDNNPGDGVKDGTCQGTKRKCDRVTECVVPKCEIAASAERCAVIGGTVGKGRDCSTACEE
jgi:hypothetical protein